MCSVAWLAVGAAFTPDRAQGGGVSAAFRCEVSTEADHVDPASQSVVRVVFAELPGQADQPVYMVGDVEEWECFWADAAVAEAEVSATFTNDTRHRRPNSAAVSPAW